MSLKKKIFNSVIKAIDEADMTLTALVSTAAKDRMDESLDPLGVDLKNYRKNPVVLWAHNYEMPPIGKAQWVKRTKDGVLSKVKFAPTELGREVFELYKENYLNAFSVGFIPKKVDDGEKSAKGKDKPRRVYTEWELLEYSAVPVPANPEALALAMQKGILTDEVLIEQIQKEIDEDDREPTDEELKEIEQEQEEIEGKKVLGLDEVLAENALLYEKCTQLKQELQDLKYQFYKTTQQIQKELSEKAVKDATDKVCDILDGAFRKATGKIN